MMTEKIFGAFCLFAVALWRVYDIYRQTRVKNVRATAWIALFTYIRGQIACFNHPLDQILSRADPALIHATGIEDIPKEPFAVMCLTAADEFGGEIGKILTDLAGKIGTLARQELLSSFDEALPHLEKAVSDAKAQAYAHDRLNATLQLCGVLGVILLFW